MLIKHPRRWESPARLVTPEALALDRRRLLTGATASALAIGVPGAASAQGADPSADLYPAPKNPKWTVPQPVTPEEVASRYNNFFEFGSHKGIYLSAARLKTRPWTVKVDGLVAKPFEIGIDDLLRKVQLEERIVRHRCVEAWSMVVPWTGFQLAEIVRMAEPQAGAKYLRLETFRDPEVASGQRQSWFPWPYAEGLTLAEATHELAFMVTGAYGKPLVPQFGAPIRLHLPWKYGFKSIKSIVRISFVAERPKSFWQEIQGDEYGFWANVNPAAPHPRWSQARERVLGSDEKIPTLLFNGYAEWVAPLYKDIQGEKLYL